MDENQLNEYIKKLPKPVQDVFFDNVWQERTIEIAKKYSLTDSQIDDLTDIVSLTIIGLQNPDDILETTIGDLGISRLLAEQIIEDLESRVFGYALKLIENKEKPKTSSINTSPAQINQNYIGKVPEVKPKSLPAVEMGEKAHDTTPEEKKFFATKPVEPVQKPYSVPRFGMASVPPKVSVINMNQNKPTTPQNMMDNKMNMITTNIPADMQKKQNPTPPIPPTKYNADPYREPLG